MLHDAATLILYREEADGLHVLMGLRNAHHKFMPSRVVFPGGRVDAEDYTAEPASPLPKHAMARLLRAAPAGLAAALANAAARELEEETGLTLGSPPELAGLDYLCRAETPEHLPIRFNARFFVGPAELASGTFGGSGELEMLDWYAMERLLQLDVPPITHLILEELRHWHALTDAERISRKARLFRFPSWLEE